MHGVIKTLARPAVMYSPEDLELLEQLAAMEARDSFWNFRRYMRPKMKIGWFQREVASELQKFYDDWRAGRAPIIALLTPPQHGKSTTIVDFIAWAQGKDPDSRAIYASFSDRLGIRANLWLQRQYMSDRYRAVFPGTRINDSNVVTIGGSYLRNHEILEYVDRNGSFRNTTVNGSVNGEGLDLGVIDDPIKGRAEASSKTVRDKTWEWFTDDFFGRFSETAALIVIVTRWHVDDPIGRMIDHFGKRLRVLKYHALATSNEEHRRRGDALFPEIKSKKFLLERKSLLTQSGWESTYQQEPIVVGGGLFPVDKFRVEPALPPKRDVRKSVRYWDKAGTQDGGAFTCGVLMHLLSDETFMVTDVQRGQWSALKREEMIRQTAEIDNSGALVDTWVEQEPGSGGKESAENTVRRLRGFSVYADRVTGKKEVRAEPYAAQVQGGNVALHLNSKWNREFLDEHEMFPSGKYKDQVDAAGGAFSRLVSGSSYTLDNIR